MAAGPTPEIYFAIGQCSLGSILAAQSSKGVCSILIGDDPDVLIHVTWKNDFRRLTLIGNEPGYEQLVAKGRTLVEQLSAKASICLSIFARTAFQQRVWKRVEADSAWLDRELCRHRGEDRHAEGCSGCGTGVRRKTNSPLRSRVIEVVRNDGSLIRLSLGSWNGSARSLRGRPRHDLGHR